MARLLSLFGGYTTAWGSNSWEGATFASAATLGTIHVENSRDDLLNSRFIILWGCDPAVTVHGTNTLWYLIQAKEKGVKIVSVDPRFTRRRSHPGRPLDTHPAYDRRCNAHCHGLCSRKGEPSRSGVS